MIIQVPLDKFSENLETQNITWVSKDGRRSATEMFHMKLQRSFTQIEKLSSSEDEYLEALKTLCKYPSAQLNNKPSFESSLLRMYMFASDLVVSQATLNQKQYKYVFLVDFFESDLKQYLESRKAKKNSFSLREVYACFHQVAASVQSAFDHLYLQLADKQQAPLEISQVKISNFVLSMPHPTLLPSFKFVYIPFLAVFDNDENYSNSTTSLNNNNSHSLINYSPQNIPNSQPSSFTQFIQNKSHVKSQFNSGKKQLGTSPINSNSSSSMSYISGSSNILANAASNSLSSLHKGGQFGQLGYDHKQLSHSTSSNRLIKEEPRSTSSYKISASTTYSPQDKILFVEQQAVRDMGEVFVRIATQSVEEWADKEEEDILGQNGGATTKLRKGIRQISIKYSQNLGNLVQKMTSSSKNELPRLNSICGILSSLEQESSMQMIDQLNSQKHVKFDTAKEEKENISRSNSNQLHISDLNYYGEKNKLISISPSDGGSGLVIIDLNDPKKTYLERIDLENLTQSSIIGSKCANILFNDNYTIFIFGGVVSLKVNKYQRYSTSFEQCAQIPGKTSRSSFGIAIIGMNVFIINGCDGDQTISDCLRYDTTQNQWKKLSNSPTAAKDISLCVFNNQALFKIGGIGSDGTLLQFIEKYDITTNSWFNVPFNTESAIQQRFELLANSLSVQVNETQILVLGGQKGNKDSALQAKQSFILNVSSLHGVQAHTISHLNHFGILPDSTPLYNDQFAINQHELIFLQLKNKPNAARIISFSYPAGIKILRNDLKW